MKVIMNLMSMMHGGITRYYTIAFMLLATSAPLTSKIHKIFLSLGRES